MTEENSVRVGRIVGLSGDPMSGLWLLELEEMAYDEGVPLYPVTVFVPIESGYGVRTLAACFGATEGTGDLLEKIVGREIEYEVDDLGILLRFAPTEFADFGEAG